MNIKNNKAEYRFHPQLIVRTPLVPLQKANQGIEALKEFSKKSFFMEAIYLASPVLYAELVKWHNNELSDSKQIDKLIVSLYKYYSRMQNRSTPYGLFAGCSVATWDTATDISFNNKHKRHTRLDMNFVCALAQHLSTHPSVLPHLRFTPNKSIYPVGEQLRYIEYYYADNRRVHQITSVDTTPYLKDILQNSANSATLKELADSLINDEITYEDAETFVKDIINSQLLVSNLEPSVTGDEFIHQVIAVLKGIEQNEDVVSLTELLEQIQEYISQLDEKIGNDPEEYRSIFSRLKSLNIPIEENCLFQTDLYKTPSSAKLNSSVQNDLNEAIEFLQRLSITHKNDNLDKFKEKFIARYENAEMPLLEVLDTETGIGYPDNDTNGVNALLADITLPYTVSDSTTLKLTNVDRHLNKCLQHASRNADYIVHFTMDDCKANGPVTYSSMPDSLAVMFRLIDNNLIYLHSTGGSSAVNLLGRFAHGDNSINQLVKDIVQHEENNNANKILAEIVHLPESRVGNILLRPVFRKYEIPYLGKSALSENHQVLLQDLTISIHNGRIVLRSIKLNTEILPRLSTAHNYSFNALPVYRFLCDMQIQDIDNPGIGFSWGALGGTYKFLPRAMYKNVILSRARWNLNKDDLNLLLKSSPENLLVAVSEWKAIFNLPDKIILADNDNELFVDLTDTISVSMFISTIKNRNEIALEEHLQPSPEIKDEAGNIFANEIIAVRLQDNKTRSNIKNLPDLKTNAVQRTFFTGSEWLYYKIYCGVKTAEKLLTDIIQPLTEELLEEGWADSFFFLRYADPDTHIRLRFHTSNTSNIGNIISLVHKYLDEHLKNGSINKIQTDVYKRELERYGENTIELTESLFHADSAAALNFLKLIDSGDAGDELRWQYSLLSIDDLLTSFGYTLETKLRLMEAMKDSFFTEHGGDKDLKIQLDTKFRNMRKNIDQVLGRSFSEEFIPIANILSVKKELIHPIAVNIKEFAAAGKLQVDMNDLMCSYIHMLVNRLFISRQRTCEMVVYDLLYRYYNSLQAKEKGKLKQALA